MLTGLMMTVAGWLWLAIEMAGCEKADSAAHSEAEIANLMAIMAHVSI